MSSKVIVIGGGAAGMMAAIGAANAGHKVLLLEKNEKLGKKIFITGKGRCNLTNACETEELFASVVTNPKFLYSAFYAYTQEQIMDLMEQNGCPVKVERGNRVFPVSDHSSDVIRALQRSLSQLGIEVRLFTEVKELLLEPFEANEESPKEDRKRTVKCVGVLLEEGRKEYADHIILATGGLSYPTTGSTGDGYRMAEPAGHNLKKPVPALVPICIREEWCKELQGLSLKNVSLRMVQGKKVLYEGFGEMLFTHFGVSGPLVLSASSFLGKAKGEEPVKLVLNLKPALDGEQLDKRILRDFEENQNRKFENALAGLLPSKMIPVMVELSKVPGEKRVNLVSREERTAFRDLLQELTMTVAGTRGFSEAIITQGGIPVKEVDPSTMQSKSCKGLSFAGEVLDLDAVTGGFNLQIAWSTGYLAGISIE